MTQRSQAILRTRDSAIRTARIHAVIVLLMVAGCTGRVSSTDMTGFGRSAAVISKQAEIVMLDANRLGREARVEEFIRQGRPGLTEAAFPSLIPSDVSRAWLDALGGLERYGLLLGSLSDPDRASDATAAVGDFAKQLDGLGMGLGGGVAAGFAGLAGAAVDGAAQRRARGFLKITDPKVRQLLTAMAAAVGNSDDEGLRGTVRANWTRTFGPLQNAYATATERHDEALRRTTIASFLERVDRRDAQLRSLAAFRLSLLALADAHGAAAAGSRRPAAELLGVLERRLDETRDAYDAVTEGERK